MDLIALAVPFFLLALLIELFVDWRSKSGFYRSNDAINSLSAGILSTTIGYFTRFLPLIAWGWALERFALIDMPLAWFDFSTRGLALWAVALLAWDLCYYWFHRFSHEISILWAAHAVHHQSEEYNLSTALRQTSTSFLYDWIFYLPIFLIGFPLEVVIVVRSINLIYQFWVHTRVVHRLGVLDRILVTPSNHRVHHAQNDRYMDRNYGGMLILWDRIFGTWQEELEDEPVVFGVTRPLANWNPFWANLQVYNDLLFDARHAGSWRDRLGLWFQRTGWRPADVATRFPRERRRLSAFRKYDPPVAADMRRYVVAQFIVAILGTLLIARLYAAEGASAVLIPCGMLWLQLYTLGLLNEDRPGARRLEWYRLAALTPALVVLQHVVDDGWSTAMLGAVLSYFLVSMAWFGALRPRQELLK